jgi:4-amino-4-deoxy-L-arabinose transferase-like glycosyltransferase
MKKHLPITLVILTFFLRLYYALVVHPPESFIQSDIQIYGRISDAILASDWKVSHFFQPIGFPMILAGIKLLAHKWSYWLAFLQSIAGALSVYLCAHVATVLWGRKLGVATLIVGCLHVPWVIYTGYAMPETFYTLFLTLLLWSSMKIVKSEKKVLPSILWALSFVLAFWIKGQHAFLLPLFLAGLWLTAQKKNLVPIFLISAIVAGGMAGHWAFSHAKTGVGKFSGDAGGLNLVEGKCPSKKNTDPETNITWWSPLYYDLHMSQHKRWDRPFSDSGYYMKEGMKCIVQNPWVMVQSLENVPYLFFGNSLWPVSFQPIGHKVRLYEVLFVLFVVPGLLIFFLYMARYRKLDELLIWGLPVLSLFLCVYVFKSEIRYRIPFDVFIIPMALRGLSIVLSAVWAKEPSFLGGNSVHVAETLTRAD